MMKEVILDSFDEVFDTVWSETQEDKMGSLQFELPLLNDLAWLSNQTFEQQYFWKSRNQGISRAGLGQLIVLSGNKERAYQDALSEMTTVSIENNCHFFGGSSFSLNANKEGSIWDDIPGFYFVVPEIELVSGSEKSVLNLNFMKVKRKDNEASLKALINAIVFKDSFVNQEEGVLEAQSSLPGFEQWELMVEELKESISNSEMEKSVLARQVEQRFKKAPCPYFTCYKNGLQNQNCFTFLLKFKEDSVFFGHSPERLCHIDDKMISTEALAGTMKRGKTLKQEKELEEQLLSKRKESQEQGIVLDYLQKRLGFLCEHMDEPSSLEVIKLANVQHLYQLLSGSLKNNFLLSDIVSELHPTPAVCGEPKLTAKAFINRVEPFSRGWYAGFIGLFSDKDSDIAVSIRSVLQTRSIRYLFSGAGILNQSDSKEEWAELDQKIAQYL